jgi:hypothetical protein
MLLPVYAAWFCVSLRAPVSLLVELLVWFV